MPDGVAGIILAGGRSSRMGGGDKCLCLLDGRPMLAHVIERLRTQVKAMALNANGNPYRFCSFGLDVIADPLPDLGPLGGILAGMKWAEALPSDVSHIMTVAADTPFFPTILGEQLVATGAETGRVVLASSADRLHPTFGLWPISLRNDLEAFLAREGAASVRAFAGLKQPPVTVDFPALDGIDPFFNVNTPEDLVAARMFLGKGSK